MVRMVRGGYGEHTAGEHLVIAEWLQTLSLARNWLAEFPLPIYHR